MLNLRRFLARFLLRDNRMTIILDYLVDNVLPFKRILFLATIQFVAFSKYVVHCSGVASLHEFGLFSPQNDMTLLEL